MFFPGHLQVAEKERADLRVAVNDFLERSLAKLEDAGLPVQIVSGGSTPTAREGHLFTGVNEIRPGMYIFNDRNMLAVGVASRSEEHTSELQSQSNLVCRLLLEKKKKNTKKKSYK